MTITIAGLGPGRRGLRTLETAEAIAVARTIVLRTAIHPDTEEFLDDPRVVACDDIYNAASSFDAVYEGVANRVIELAGAGDVLYLTPGHPFVGEFTTRRIVDLAAERGIRTRVLSAVSALDEMAAVLRVDLMADEPQLYDATTLALALDREPFSAGLVDLSPFRPVLVTQVYSPEMATATKLALGRVFGEEIEIRVVRSAGTSGQSIQVMPLHRLDRADVDHLTSIWIDPLPEIAAGRAFASLVRIVARLRAPEGCPWDRKQDARSLVNSLLEEAYEAVEAIESEDAEHAAEELGDLLLLIAMEAQIAEEEGLFQIEDVIENISAKLIRRHPHVFGNASAGDADDVVGIWQRVKAAEGKQPKPTHPLDRYPAPMPVARRLIDLLSVEAPVAAIDAQEVGEQLYRLTRAAIEAGHNPEQLLLDAARRDIPERSAP